MRQATAVARQCPLAASAADDQPCDRRGAILAQPRDLPLDPAERTPLHSGPRRPPRAARTGLRLPCRPGVVRSRSALGAAPRCENRGSEFRHRPRSAHQQEAVKASTVESSRPPIPTSLRLGPQQVSPPGDSANRDASVNKPSQFRPASTALGGRTAASRVTNLPGQTA